LTGVLQNDPTGKSVRDVARRRWKEETTKQANVAMTTVVLIAPESEK
jgi:hypothetical protein